MSLLGDGMRFEDQEPSWESQCSAEQAAECKVRSFLKSICLVPFVWFQIVPGVLVYVRVKIIIFKACPLHGLHLSSPWSQKRCLALEVYFLSTFFGDANKHICVVAALGMSIWFQCRELQHHCLHVAAVGVEMPSLRLLLEASTSWKKKVIEYWLLSSRPLHPCGGVCVPVSWIWSI